MPDAVGSVKRPDMMSKHNQVLVERRFQISSPQRVFDAWVDPGLAGRWMFDAAITADRKQELVDVRIEPRVGGSFSFVVRGNGHIIDHTGRYLHMNRPHRLVFTWGLAGETQEDRVIVDLVPTGTGSFLTLVHELHAQGLPTADAIEADWIARLDALSALLGEPLQ